MTCSATRLGGLGDVKIIIIRLQRSRHRLTNTRPDTDTDTCMQDHARVDAPDRSLEGRTKIMPRLWPTLRHDGISALPGSAPPRWQWTRPSRTSPPGSYFGELCKWASIATSMWPRHPTIRITPSHLKIHQATHYSLGTLTDRHRTWPCPMKGDGQLRLSRQLTMSVICT